MLGLIVSIIIFIIVLYVFFKAKQAEMINNMMRDAFVLMPGKKMVINSENWAKRQALPTVYRNAFNDPSIKAFTRDEKGNTFYHRTIDEIKDCTTCNRDTAGLYMRR